MNPNNMQGDVTFDLAESLLVESGGKRTAKGQRLRCMEVQIKGQEEAASGHGGGHGDDGVII